MIGIMQRTKLHGTDKNFFVRMVLSKGTGSAKGVKHGVTSHKTNMHSAHRRRERQSFNEFNVKTRRRKTRAGNRDQLAYFFRLGIGFPERLLTSPARHPWRFLDIDFHSRLGV